MSRSPLQAASRRPAAWFALLVALVLAGACSHPHSGSSAPAQSAVPHGPARCAGDEGTSPPDGRLAQWQFAADRLADDPAAQVWLSFSRTLSPSEAGDALESLTAHGVLLVYEQRQGTYVKVQERFAAAPVADRAVERSAKEALTGSLQMSIPPSVGHVDAFDPVDENVGTTNIPIAALLVSGDIGTAINHHRCLIYSLSAVDADAPPIAPSIEPLTPIIDGDDSSPL